MSRSVGSLDTLCQLHSQGTASELEMRFGTRGKPIDRIAFDRVIGKLKSEGFASATPAYMLRIQTEYMDPRTGGFRLSNVRVTVDGLASIQSYCKTDEITSGDRNEANPGVTFEMKAGYKQGNDRVPPLDMNEWNVRVSLQAEEQLTDRDGRVKQIVSEWGRSRKVFRLVKRYSFRHVNYALRVDMSIVRSSRRTKTGRMIPAMTYAEARVSEQPEHYEIEIEVSARDAHNQRVPHHMRQVCKTVLAGIQDSNFPIPGGEIFAVSSEYYTLVNGKAPDGRIRPRDFIGPSSVSLELPNIVGDSDAKVSVLEGYAVTDKADGLRKMLYVAESGKMYFLDTNMNVQFTGMRCDDSWRGTLMDGEHIVHDKFGVFYNAYAAFDCYFVRGEDVRKHPLVTSDGQGGRIKKLSVVLAGIEPTPIVPDARPLRVSRKSFYSGDNVFANCNAVMQRIKDGTLEYETDGMMFTPLALGVGMEPDETTPPNRKRTWRRSFKWKPPEHNSIDFLCTTAKEAGGDDLVKTVFTDGVAMSEEGTISQYKSFVLRVGYDEKAHGYLDPCQQVMDGNYPTSKQSDRVSDYKPAPFHPTNPSDASASLCYLMMNAGTGNTMTENKREVVEDGTIVEFRYDPLREAGWRWIPIKVRHDKTADMRSGGRNYGNAYHVAESVWTSIHNPVTEDMLMTGEGIPSITSDAYYLSSGASTTSPMRDFHNFCIKRKMLRAIIRPGNTLLDLGAGKAGDLHKWIAARVALVVGVDSCRDCIENRVDGACARYLNAFTTYRAVPPMFFLYGEASQSIVGGEALLTASGKRTMRALLGEGPRDPETLGRAVFQNYGKAKDGFNVISCQFALHYFFRDLETFNGLLDNIAALCAQGGYFAGACFDGKRVFRALEGKKTGDGICISLLHETLCEISKQYDATVFRDDETCLGYAVDVYQDSINNQIREYLVNFAYLETRLAEKGIRPITVEEARGLGLLGAIVPFGDVFQSVQLAASSDRRLRANLGSALTMTDPEKEISFLNNMFVFRKAGQNVVHRKKTQRARTLVVEN